MNGMVARDPRVLAILTRPDDYFDNARRNAWQRAREDVAADLERRATLRRNGGRPEPVDRSKDRGPQS